MITTRNLIPLCLFLISNVFVHAQNDTTSLLRLVDLDTTSINLDFRLADTFAGSDSYFLRYYDDTRPGSYQNYLYQYDGNGLRLLFQAEQGKRLDFLKRFGDNLLFIVSEGNNTPTVPYLLHDENASITELPQMFNSFRNLLADDEAFSTFSDLPDGRTLFVSDNILYATNHSEGLTADYLFDFSGYEGTRNNNPTGFILSNGNTIIISGRQVLLSDGTPEGTTVNLSLNDIPATDFTQVNDQVFLTTRFMDITVTDGTAAGTTVIYRRDDRPDFPNNLNRQIALGDSLLFWASGELWIATDTPGDVHPVIPDAQDDVFSGLTYIDSFENKWYYIRELEDRCELWTSDGTQPGTRRLFNSDTSSTSDIIRSIQILGRVGNHILFDMSTDETSPIYRDVWVYVPNEEHEFQLVKKDTFFISKLHYVWPDQTHAIFSIRDELRSYSTLTRSFTFMEEISFSSDNFPPGILEINDQAYLYTIPTRDNRLAWYHLSSPEEGLVPLGSYPCYFSASTSNSFLPFNFRNRIHVPYHEEEVSSFMQIDPQGNEISFTEELFGGSEGLEFLHLSEVDNALIIHDGNSFPTAIRSIRQRGQEIIEGVFPGYSSAELAYTSPSEYFFRTNSNSELQYTLAKKDYSETRNVSQPDIRTADRKLSWEFVPANDKFFFLQSDQTSYEAIICDTLPVNGQDIITCDTVLQDRTIFSLRSLDPYADNTITEIVRDTFETSMEANDYQLRTDGEQLYFSWPCGRNRDLVIQRSDGTVAGTSLHPGLDYAYVDTEFIHPAKRGVVVIRERSQFNPRPASISWWPKDKAEILNFPLNFNATSIRVKHVIDLPESTLVILSAQESGVGLVFIRIDRDDNYEVIPTNFSIIDWIETYNDDEVIFTARPSSSGNENNQDVYRFRPTDNMPIRWGILRVTSRDDTPQIVKDRIYYVENPFSTMEIGFFDIGRRVNGNILLSPDLQQFGIERMQAADNTLYVTARSKISGRQLYYLDEESGRLISGNLFYDTDNDGSPSTGELPISNRLVKLNGGLPQSVTTDTEGNYAFLVTSNSGQSVSVDTPSCSSGGFSPTGYSIPADSSDQVFNFGFEVGDGEQAVDLLITPGRVRCGFTVPYWIQIVNTGCSSLAGTVRLDLPDESTFVSASLPPDNITPGQISWELDTLLPLEQQRIRVELVMPDEMFIGQPVSVSTLFANNAGFILDSTTTTNVLRCAYDPNDKLVQPTRMDPDSNNYILREEIITYTVRFQNTGNDTAQTVRIVDVLDQGLEWSTLTPTASSHEYVTKLNSRGQVTFLFENIMLPDSNINESASHGFIRFDIKPKPQGPPSEVINNSAEIYFDFNFPIFTNTVKSTIAPYLDEDNDGFWFWKECDDQNPDINPNAFEIGGNGVDENCDGEDAPVSVTNTLTPVVLIYPNPFQSLINVEISQVGTFRLFVHDLNGRNILKQDFVGSTEVNLAQSPSGIYSISVFDEDGQWQYRKLVLKH